MKHLRLAVLLACTYCLSASPVSAQDAPAFKTEAQQATQQLAAAVSLDDARLLPVRRLTQARLAQEAEMRQLYANDPAMLQLKLRNISQEYTTQLSTMLTAAQRQRYLATPAGALPVAVAPLLMPVPAPVATPRKDVVARTVTTSGRRPTAARSQKPTAAMGRRAAGH